MSESYPIAGVVEDTRLGRENDVHTKHTGIPCCLSQTVCLRGCIRCTESHLKFESNVFHEIFQPVKSGFLQVKAGQGKWPSRYWCLLKHNKFSWYKSRTDPYFPLGLLDLRHATLLKHNEEEPCFLLHTDTDILELSDTSTGGKKEWIELIHMAILWSQKNGDRVEISIPYSAILEVKISGLSGVQVVTSKDSCLNSVSFYQFHDPLAALGKFRDAIETFRHARNVSEQTILALPESPTGDTRETAARNPLALLLFLFSRLFQTLFLNRRLGGIGVGQAVPFKFQGLSTKNCFEYPTARTADALDGQNPNQCFIAFRHDETEVLLERFPGYIHRSWPVFGHFFVSSSHFSFKSSSRIAGDLMMVIPLCDILSVEKMMPTRLRYWGLIVNIRGYEEIFLKFGAEAEREALATLLEHQIDNYLNICEQETMVAVSKGEKQYHNAGQSAISRSAKTHFLDPSKTLHFTFLTIGSRGDVQPYIALAKGLMSEGHRCRLATHAEFKEWIESHDLEFRVISGDAVELVRICTEHGLFTLGYFKERLMTSKWDNFIPDQLKTAWEACQGTDVIIECPSAVAGYHVAEALGIPYFRVHLMPWSRTRAYPHGYGAPANKRGGTYNYMSYVLFDQIFGRLPARKINKFRREVLHLPPTTIDEMETQKIPFLYNFSPVVVPPPLDWPEWISITGYWILSDADQWTPPDSLVTFLENARNLGRKIVYIGFGSVVVRDPETITHCVIEAVVKSGVHAILSKGWSDRLHTKTKVANEPAEPLPPQVYPIASIPHDWLFGRIDAACHHGGAGTTGASLRAGIPTIIHPFFGDQYFWASRVQTLGVGTSISKLTVPALTEALLRATTDSMQVRRAKALGKRLQAEDGVANAIQTIYKNMDYSRSLIKRRLTPDS